jgi:Family of unknown function (DUF6502)
MSYKTKEVQLDPIASQASVRKEIKRLLEGTLDLAFDYGLDTIELGFLLREVSIRQAVKRQLRPGVRVSISRIAVVTGISRGEISSLINSGSIAKSKAASQESVLNRILRAWRSDPSFLSRRRPKPLTLFGKAASFESLVKKYGRGLPIRAILDELMSVEAIEVLASQVVVQKKPFATKERTTRKPLQLLLEQIVEPFANDTIDESAIKKTTNSRSRRKNFKRGR